MSRQRVLVFVLGMLTSALPGCSGGSTPTSPTPPGPSQARITVTATAPIVSLSPRAGFVYRITIPVTIAEGVGIGANINFVRLRQLLAGIEIERSEVSSTDLIVGTGTNRLNASATRQINLIYDVNDGRATSGILTFNFTDDRANVQSVDFTVTY